MVLTMMRHESKQLLSCKKKCFIMYCPFVCFSALPDCSYTSARQDVTVVAMDDILFSRSSNDCKRFCDDARYNFRSILYTFSKLQENLSFPELLIVEVMPRKAIVAI